MTRRHVSAVVLADQSFVPFWHFFPFRAHGLGLRIQPVQHERKQLLGAPTAEVQIRVGPLARAPHGVGNWRRGRVGEQAKGAVPLRPPKWEERLGCVVGVVRGSAAVAILGPGFKAGQP